MCRRAKTPGFPPGEAEWPLSRRGVVDPAPAPALTTTEKVELTADSEEVTVGVKARETCPNKALEQRKEQAPQAPPLSAGLPPPPKAGRQPSTACSSHPPPPQLDASSRGRFGASHHGGQGAPPWPSRGGARAGRGPPPLHGMPPPNHVQGSDSALPLHQLPPAGGAARGRGGARPGGRPPPRRGGSARPPRPRALLKQSLLESHVHLDFFSRVRVCAWGRGGRIRMQLTPALAFPRAGLASAPLLFKRRDLSSTLPSFAMQTLGDGM